MKIRIATFSAAAMLLTTPVTAGEITGNGKPIEINARTECAYSGLNDFDGDPRDPGFKTQNYGTIVSNGFINPDTLDPNDPDAFFVPIPGFACNPNRYHDLHSDG